jgi:DNA-binding response OmpR family regulator
MTGLPGPLSLAPTAIECYNINRSSQTMCRRILVIEDDKPIGRLLKSRLEETGFSVTQRFDGESGLEKALSGRFHLIILDLKLPGLDGWEVCRRIRAHSPRIPILMLTSMSSELDRVLGLELGADDYLTKPFSLRELVARVKALLRRVEAPREGMVPASQGRIRSGELIIDSEKREVRIKDTPVELTAKEFDLLLHFARHPGRVYSRAQLLDDVWGYAFKGYEHTVNSHINRLRGKIEEDPAEPRYIKTVWGVGYKFTDPKE